MALFMNIVKYLVMHEVLFEGKIFNKSEINIIGFKKEGGGGNNSSENVT